MVYEKLTEMVESNGCLILREQISQARRRKLLHSIFENCTVTSISNFRNGRRYAMSFSDKDAEKIQFPSKQVKSVS